MMTNVNNNRSKLFVNDDGNNMEEQKDILAARAKKEVKPAYDLRIALFRKVKLELNAA